MPKEESISLNECLAVKAPSLPSFPFFFFPTPHHLLFFQKQTLCHLVTEDFCWRIWPLDLSCSSYIYPVFFNKVFWKHGIFCKLFTFLSKTAFFIIRAPYSGGRDWLVLFFRTLNLIVLWFLLHQATQHPFLITVQWTAQYIFFPCAL